MRHSWIKIGHSKKRCVTCKLISELRTLNRITKGYYFYEGMGSVEMDKAPKCK
jgi:hypothetical protein